MCLCFINKKAKFFFLNIKRKRSVSLLCSPSASLNQEQSAGQSNIERSTHENI